MEPSLGARRNTILKEQLAGAVKEESLQRELRRLNIESPSLDFFELRDRGIQWIGRKVGKTAPVVAEETKISPSSDDVQSLESFK